MKPSLLLLLALCLPAAGARCHSLVLFPLNFIASAEAATNTLQRPSASPHIHFAGLAEARRAIIDDKADPYFSKLQSAEMSAKTGRPITGATLLQQRAECRRRYQAAMMDFTLADRQTLGWYVTNIYPMLRRDYPRFAATPWNFLKTTSTLESGLPHTRGAYIVLSDSFLSHLTDLKNRWPATARSKSYGLSLLIHEQCHVFQRAHPQLFAKMYTQAWNFKHASSIASNRWLQERQLLNPDGTDIHWIYPVRNGRQTSWIWPLIILPEIEPHPQSLSELSEVSVNLEVKANGFRPRAESFSLPLVAPLAAVRPYVVAFAPASEIFHPNEIEADLFSSMVLSDNQAGIRGNNSQEWPIITALRTWCRANLR